MGWFWLGASVLELGLLLAQIWRPPRTAGLLLAGWPTIGGALWTLGAWQGFTGYSLELYMVCVTVLLLLAYAVLVYCCVKVETVDALPGSLWLGLNVGLVWATALLVQRHGFTTWEGLDAFHPPLYWYATFGGVAVGTFVWCELWRWRRAWVEGRTLCWCERCCCCCRGAYRRV